MSDDPTRRSPSAQDQPDGTAGPQGADRPGGAAPPRSDDPLAAFERLQSLGSTGAPRSGGERAAAAPPRRPRPPRPARGRSLPVARMAAPAVFLVAVIVLLSLVFQSGVIGGRGQATPSTPKATPAATKTKGAQSGGGATKVYVVKAGDTPSGIAAKYSISLAQLQALNPGKKFTTIVVGEKIKVPKK